MPSSYGDCLSDLRRCKLRNRRLWIATQRCIKSGEFVQVTGSWTSSGVPLSSRPDEPTATAPPHSFSIDPEGTGVEYGSTDDEPAVDGPPVSEDDWLESLGISRTPKPYYNSTTDRHFVSIPFKGDSTLYSPGYHYWKVEFSDLIVNQWGVDFERRRKDHTILVVEGRQEFWVKDGWWLITPNLVSWPLLWRHSEGIPPRYPTPGRTD